MQQITYDHLTNEVRCHKCGKMIANRYKFSVGGVEIKCPRCKILNKIKFE